MEIFFADIEKSVKESNERFKKIEESVEQLYDNDETDFDVFESIQKNLEAIYEKQKN